MFELLLGLVIGWVCRWIYGIILNVYGNESISHPEKPVRTYSRPTIPRETTIKETQIKDTIRQDAIEALAALGFRKSEAKKTVDAIRISDPTPEKLVKMALAQLRKSES